MKQDKDKAMEWLEKAYAGSLDIISVYEYAWTEEDDAEAREYLIKFIEWIEQTAEAGDPRAMNILGYLYEKGISVEQNSEKAQEWYGKAESL